MGPCCISVCVLTTRCKHKQYIFPTASSTCWRVVLRSCTHFSRNSDRSWLAISLCQRWFLEKHFFNIRGEQQLYISGVLQSLAECMSRFTKYTVPLAGNSVWVDYSNIQSFLWTVYWRSGKYTVFLLDCIFRVGAAA